MTTLFAGGRREIVGKSKKVNKSADDGKFVTDEKVRKSPKTTYKQKVPVKKGKK
jgi:predicted methyltransferase MtxX (methanogen marker protein 4)